MPEFGRSLPCCAAREAFGPGRTARVRRPLAWRIALAGLAGWLAAPAHAFITVGPDADAACNFHDIQSAVVHAAQSPGPDVVAITSGTWSAQSPILVSDAGDITIEGGFADCSAGISSGRSELNGAAVQPGGSMIHHAGTNHLTLMNLDIAQTTGANGGGVDSEGSGRLTLLNVQLRGNSADLGGGLFLAGPGAGNPRKVVELLGVAFVSNTARGDGGGLYARDSDITVRSARVDNYFLSNTAQGQLPDSGDGGAMFLADSTLDVSARGIAGGSIGYMTGNTANRRGGAIFATSTSTTDLALDLENDDASYPLRFTANSAPTGGLLTLRPTSSGRLDMRITNAIVEHNAALDGVVEIDAAGNGSVASLRMEQTPSHFSSAPACARGLECNTFDQNGASNGDVFELVSNGGKPAIALDRARVRGNSAHAGLIYGTSAVVAIDRSLVADNDVGHHLVSNDSEYVRIADSTIANNRYSPGAPVVRMLVAPATLVMQHSLLLEPEHIACETGDAVSLIANDIGIALGGAGCLPFGTHGIDFIDDPFADAAGRDYHLRADSPAIDRWQWQPTGSPPDPPTVDLDGVPLPQVIVPGTSTPYDLGAYEFQADAIFGDGFEDLANR